MKQDCTNDSALTLIGISKEHKLIGSWLSESGYGRTSKGYSFEADGTGEFFLWNNRRARSREVTKFKYHVCYNKIFMIFENPLHSSAIPFSIERNKLIIKDRNRKEDFVKF